MSQPRVIILANREKPSVEAALGTFRPWLGVQRATLATESDASAMTEESAAAAPGC